MKILIAEDNAVSRRMLEVQLTRWGHEVVMVSDGISAWKAMEAPDAPSLFILDWMMPVMDGATLCRKFRESFPDRPAYIILLTALAGRSSMLAGLDAGVDDYIAKPFHPDELKARLNAGLRVVTLQQTLAAKAEELAATHAAARTLRDLLPMCSYCKKIRNDRDYWQHVDHYLADHTGAQVQPSICPPCHEKKTGPKLVLLRDFSTASNIRPAPVVAALGRELLDERKKAS